MYFKIVLLLFLAIGMLIQPSEILRAALSGLSLWWHYVLPALLPFFILSDLLIGTGLVRFLGLLLEPLMRPLFRLPGSASFVVAMGYTSGFPMGAVLTNRLFQNGELTRREAEHLVAFTNNPSPGFMFGAVAAGMMSQSYLGPVIAVSVYLANLLIGILMRFYHPPQNNSKASPVLPFWQSWREAATQQKLSQQPFGQLLGDSIRHSITTVLAVGGFIVFFSVILRLLIVCNILPFFAAQLHNFLPVYSPSAWEALLNGIMEMTLGCQNTVQAFTDIPTQVGLVCFLMGWGGLSVLAQVAGFSDSSLRLKPYIICRFFHAFIALGLSQVFLHFVKTPASSISVTVASEVLWPDIWRLNLQVFLICMSVLLVFLITRYLLRKL